MKRIPTTQQVTWFLDLFRTGQLDLDPPYQRKSVWSPRDRRFFLDTIFRNYPAPPVFIHRETDDFGKTYYRVVDGKQRLETIINFADNKIALAKDFGDDRYNGRKFKNLEISEKRDFWDYTLVVDFIDSIEGTNIEEVFDRVNRNSKNLNQQELRHARFDGWLINYIENEVEDEFWWEFKLNTKARDKRMSGAQFVSELAIFILSNFKIQGFDQESITEYYARFDDEETLLESEFNFDDFKQRVEINKEVIIGMDHENGCIKSFAAGSNTHFLSLWQVLSTMERLDPVSLGQKYHMFMSEVEAVNPEEFNDDSDLTDFMIYKQNSMGASTEKVQRLKRYEILKRHLDVENS